VSIKYLASNSQLMAQLSFAGSELTKQLGDGSCFNAALEQLVKLF